jgi:hypothetical protein
MHDVQVAIDLYQFESINQVQPGSFIIGQEITYQEEQVNQDVQTVEVVTQDVLQVEQPLWFWTQELE